MDCVKALIAGSILAMAVASRGWGAKAQPVRYFVATKGNDAWTGKLSRANKQRTDGPFASLERARDEIRKLKKSTGVPEGGVSVELRGGLYERDRVFELSAEDSGTPSAPVVYRAYEGEEVRLVGGRAVTGFKPVTDPAILNRLEESARGKVIQADLKATRAGEQGITDYGDVVAAGKRFELFFQDKPMTLARWPNGGFVNILDVLNIDPVDVRGTKGDKVGKIVYEGDRPKRWAEEKDLWLHGYWFWDWADQRQRVESIDTEKRIITLRPPYHGYGYRKGQWFYAFNALSELDTPGEWYLDRESGILYFWPPGSSTQAESLRNVERSRTLVSLLPALVTMKEASNVLLRGMVLEAARGTALSITGGTGTQVVACTIRNCGGWAVSVDGGKANGVVGCDIYETGQGGISLSGGDRRTLTGAGLYADNNHVHHYSRWDRVYQPGITLYGVGNRASHNLIDNAPHMAMGFGGNDHLIEFNEIHSVCYESNDAGAIYTGRNWTMRGTVIRNNYLHHINGFEGRGCVGVYLDDQFSGTMVYGNLFHNVTRAAMIGGGRDCTIENNIFVDCAPATHVDARGLGWAAGGFEGMKGGLQEVPYQESLWKTRYPKLVNILEDDPMAPKGNTIARNICVGGRWGDFEDKAKPLVTFEDNLTEADPRFVDAAHLNFQLQDDSPAYKLGFKRIPIEKIGLYKDDRRASWPVTHKVREMAEPPAPKRVVRTAPPVFKVPGTTVAIHIDGTINPEEWGGAEPAKAMVIEQDIQGEKVAPRSLAWLAHDTTSLYVAIDNEVDKSKPLQVGKTWGQCDAVEIALRNLAAGKKSPVIVLRGFASGYWESSEEAGATAAVAKRAAQRVVYKASIVEEGRWSAEWRIPFASLGIDPKRQTRYAFNLSVRKSAGAQWLMWQGTGGCTWLVENAGEIVLAK